MRVSEYAACDATGLAELVRRREVSPQELHAVALEAIAAVDGELDAVADGPWERPLEHAREGPFAGVPFVLKDLGAHPRGVRARYGSRLTGDGIASEEESFLVERFRAAGLAIVALTTTPELGLNVSSEALAYGGPTRNPWDVSRSAGGSSGGTGALVGAGAVPAGHGNDGGGSIRIPAAFNGLVGLKVSRGRISEGPERQELAWGMAVEGFLTRTVRDCAGLLDAVAGTMPGDKFAIEPPARPWSQEVGADPGRLRIALHTETWSKQRAGTDPEVVAAVEAVAHELERLGHHVERAAPPCDEDDLLGATASLFSALVVESIDAIAAATGNRPSPDTLEHTALAFYELGRTVTALDIAKAMRAANEQTRAVGAFFAEWDLLLTPTADVPPPPLGCLNSNDPSFDPDSWSRHTFGVSSFTPLFNLSGTPAISLPLGWSAAGLPLGVQLAAPMCGEATLIRVASQLEESLPWGARRPPVHAALSSD